MVLILQIVLLVIGVGGAIVSALALDNPTWRVRSVIGFATLGATGFVLTIITYENTPNVPHLMDVAAAGFHVISGSFEFILGVIKAPLFQIGIALIIGFALYPTAIWIYDRITKRIYKPAWRTSYKIFEFGNQEAIKNLAAVTDQMIECGELLEKNRQRREQIKKPRGYMDAAYELTPEEAELVNERQDIDNAMNDLRREKERFIRIAMEDIYDQLQNSRLVAKGFLQPVGQNDHEIDIPAPQWRFLKFSADFNETSGQGISYTAIAVTRGRA